MVPDKILPLIASTLLGGGGGTLAVGIISQSSIALVAGTITIIGGAIVGLYGLWTRERIKTAAEQVKLDALERDAIAKNCEDRYTLLQAKYEIALQALSDAKIRMAIWEAQHQQQPPLQPPLRPPTTN